MSLIEDDLPSHTVASTLAELAGVVPDHPPRVLILYGSLRDKSFSRFLAEECARVLTQFGADVEIFRPNGLPVFDRTSDDHPEVQRLAAPGFDANAHPSLQRGEAAATRRRTQERVGRSVMSRWGGPLLLRTRSTAQGNLAAPAVSTLT